MGFSVAGWGAGFWLPWCAALVGLLVTVLLEQCMQPCPPLRRPLAAWSVHAGLWLLVHGALTVLLGRPWFAMAGGLALLLTVVLVNNAKFRALREPFVFQDYEYFTDAIRYPRLYIPFLGWWKFLLASAGFAAAVGIGWWWEPVPEVRWSATGQVGAVVVQALLGGLLLVLGSRKRLNLGLDAHHDLLVLGLLACLWRYALMGRRLPTAPGAFAGAAHEGKGEAGAPAPACVPGADGWRLPERLPDLVAVQSESFFDTRALFAGIRPQVLDQLDLVQAEAFLHGSMRVPAWGANTVRTEFAFLTGVESRDLGIHQFNPYRAIAGGWQVASLARYLKRLGYRTVCVHPYPAGFYLRYKVYPLLGFDAFVDIQGFADAQRYGPYVSDAAVAERIMQLLHERSAGEQPLFVLAITMENHGPLHLERVAPGDLEQLYHTPPPAGCEDLTIYLRHLRNANRMLGNLRTQLAALPRPASLCWYGDHVPIMPTVYATFGQPSGVVPYACWSNPLALAQTCALPLRPGQAARPLAAHELSRQWLAGLGLWPGPLD